MEVIATFDRTKALSFFLRTFVGAIVFAAGFALATWVLLVRPDSLRPRPDLWILLAATAPAVAWLAYMPVVAASGLRGDTPLVYVRNGRIRYALPMGVSVPVGRISDAVVQDASTGGRALVISHSAGSVTRVLLTLAHEDEAVILDRVLSMAGRDA